MGAAEGDLAGAEIVEQGACALHLCKVEFPAPLFLSQSAGIPADVPIGLCSNTP